MPNIHNLRVGNLNINSNEDESQIPTSRALKRNESEPNVVTFDDQVRTQDYIYERRRSEHVSRNSLTPSYGGSPYTFSPPKNVETESLKSALKKRRK